MSCVDCAPCKDGKPCAGGSHQYHSHALAPKRNFGAIANYGSLNESVILDIMDILTSEGVDPALIPQFISLGQQVRDGRISDREFLEQAIVLAREAGAERTALALEEKLNEIRRKEFLAYLGMGAGILGTVVTIYFLNRNYQRQKRMGIS